MIINFSVQNFGSIKDKQTLSFEATNSKDLEEYYVVEPIKGLRLLKLGLIYGANASGKTTVLKALQFLSDLVFFPFNIKNNEFEFEPFLFDKFKPNENTFIFIEFVQNNIKYSYEVEFNKKAIIREELNFFNPNKANVFKRITDLSEQLTHISFGSKIKANADSQKYLEANTLWNNTVMGGFTKTNVQIIELKNVCEWFFSYFTLFSSSTTNLSNWINYRVLSDSHEKIDKNKIIQILNKADLNISNFELERVENSSKIQITFEHFLEGNKYYLPFELESQGTQRYYGLAGILNILINTNRICLIDELESSLHPDLFTHFLMTYLVNSKNSQLLATTHNREILNNRDLFRNDAIWFTDKNESNATELYSLADFDSKVIRDTSNVYNAYKIGKLGGVPHLGDYYLDLSDEKK